LLLDLLTEVPALDAIDTEKGTRPDTAIHARWEDESLFHFIDIAMSAPRGGALRTAFSHVVCDDMGTEGADFVGLNVDTGLVVFAQAKCKRDVTQVSASALYDVCAQANKNLGFLRYGGQELPNRTRKWASRWREDYSVQPRIRKGQLGARELVDTLNSFLMKPGTRREMWLVLGRILSKSALTEQLSSRRPPAHAIQLLYLLMAVHNACKSVGVELRVFCSE
jgi:hypothetical protein